VTQPRVSVIIATWNAREVLSRCLDSVEAQRVEGGVETIVVDNASTDGTAELLRDRSDRIRVLTNDRNAFYSGANNQAAAVARGSVLLFLNSDAELLERNAIERLASALEDPRVGLVGPRLVNPDGSLQPSCAAHPSVAGALILSTGLFRLLPDRIRARLTPAHWSHDRSIDTGWVKGAALAVRADVFERLGGFWSTMYGEEQDLAYRAQALGLRVRFESAAQVMHVRNFSLGQRWSDTERGARVAAAELAFLRKHYGAPRRLAIRAIMAAGFAARVTVHRALGHRGKAALYRTMAHVYMARRPSG
jgi:N-acetylglucosaminyl-diphospho-decaprenol L-rhamnosyltransferase